MKINTKIKKDFCIYLQKSFDDFNIEVESAKLITSKKDIKGSDFNRKK